MAASTGLGGGVVHALILSNALDTNGQNARYVSAARKHGEHERIMKALAIGNYDPAGVAERFRLASEKLGGLELRAAHRTTAYFDFPVDLVWTKINEPEIRRIAAEADVIHLNNSPLAMRKLRLKKPALLHHHGTLFRSNPDAMLVTARVGKMAQAVSTVDLMKPAPDVLHWLPTAYDIGALRKQGDAARRKRKQDGRVRIVHAPTSREGKHTELFLEATRQLIAEGLPIDVVIVENKTNAECLAIKATADIVYDQLKWGYGCNSVEAWGMGIPVISGADEWTIGQMEKMWSRTPFYQATEATLKQKIKDLALSADLRAEWGDIGSNHVTTHHDELPALERLVELYRVAIRTFQRPRIAMKGNVRPVTFRNTKGKSIIVDGEYVRFSNQLLTTEDPMVIERLLYYVRERPLLGIEVETV